MTDYIPAEGAEHLTYPIDTGELQPALLAAWAAWQPADPPFVLDGDRTILTADDSAAAVVIRSSWQTAYTAPDFAAERDGRLHLGLLPHPFCGDLRRASVYVLMLNPGLGPTDYYGEYEVPGYRSAVLAMLRQDLPPDAIPFMLLDPQYAWHGGFRWWHGKFAGIIAQLADAWSIPFAEARAHLGRQIASIELMPYHSATFSAGGWLGSLPSVALARAFVRDYVVPRVLADEAIVVVTRQAAAWDLPEHPGIVRYSSGEARAAHLTPNSRGGAAILDWLLRSAAR